MFDGYHFAMVNGRLTLVHPWIENNATFAAREGAFGCIFDSRGFTATPLFRLNSGYERHYGRGCTPLLDS